MPKPRLLVADRLNDSDAKGAIGDHRGASVRVDDPPRLLLLLYRRRKPEEDRYEHFGDAGRLAWWLEHSAL